MIGWMLIQCADKSRLGKKAASSRVADDHGYDGRITARACVQPTSTRSLEKEPAQVSEPDNALWSACAKAWGRRSKSSRCDGGRHAYAINKLQRRVTEVAIDQMHGCLRNVSPATPHGFTQSSHPEIDIEKRIDAEGRSPDPSDRFVPGPRSSVPRRPSNRP